MNHQRRRFRPRQQKNNFRRRNINSTSAGSSYFQNNGGANHIVRNGSTNNPFNVEKTIQKYQQLAKDALSSGDPVLSENYFQHAEHFSRKLIELNIKLKDSTSVKKEEEKEVKIDSSQS